MAYVALKTPTIVAKKIRHPPPPRLKMWTKVTYGFKITDFCFSTTRKSTRDVSVTFFTQLRWTLINMKRFRSTSLVLKKKYRTTGSATPVPTLYSHLAIMNIQIDTGPHRALGVVAVIKIQLTMLPFLAIAQRAITTRLFLSLAQKCASTTVRAVLRYPQH